MHRDHAPTDAHAALTRHDWTDTEIRAIYDLPFMELLYRAHCVHRRFFDPSQVQMAALVSIKTGGCSENCGYCSQSAHHHTGVASEKLMEIETLVAKAQQAQAAGASRFCMGAAWRQVRGGQDFAQVLEMVRRVAALNMEVCCTLGMLTQEQAQLLAAAGLTAYNHNLDTGPAYYSKVVSTHTYEDRLQTIAHVRAAGIHLCCGGIMGMGEAVEDRVGMLGVLARLPQHPESVPINALVPIAGTPLEQQTPAQPLDIARMVATTRMVLPQSRVRLSAGRANMSLEAQALCFFAGANSLFAGEKLLTTPNREMSDDLAMLTQLGLTPLRAA